MDHSFPGITLLRGRDRTGAPWRNGGGTTWQVAACPPHAGTDLFDWRISIARVAAAGPFSHFAGIDRTLMVLRGALDLTVADRRYRLSSDDAPFGFPGDVECDGAPVGGAVTNLNVMTARAKAVARATRSTGDTIPPDGATTTILFATGACTVRTGGAAIALAGMDAAIVATGGVAWTGSAILVTIAAA